MQASFIVSLLRFWSYLIDSISQEDVIQESSLKYDIPKSIFYIVLYVTLFYVMITTRLKESDDPLYYWNNNEASLKTRILVILLFMYLGRVTYKTAKTFGGLKKNYKIIIFSTLTVIYILFGCFTIVGIQAYVSNSTSVLRIMSIEGLINLYIYLLYLFSPCSLTSRMQNRRPAGNNEHRQIINQLYEQELPEMPTMRDEDDHHLPNDYPDK